MKNKKTKYYLKNNLIGLIVGGIIFGSLGVYAAITFPSNEVSFDPSNSTLKSTNVKDAIDELYKKCTNPAAADQIIEDAGLEKDPYECRYFFTGAKPNNYITFNNEKAGWRIISVECDGTIKIMKTEDIGNMVWDTSGSNNWARPSSLNTYLNNTYYNGLNSTAKNQIVAKGWSIGAVTWNNNNLTTQITNENGTKWNGKVALATVSEYIRSNSNKSRCGSISLNNNDYNSNYKSCKNTTWMYNVEYWWTLSPNAGGSNRSFYVYAGSYISYGNGVNIDSHAVRPVVYLSSEVTLTGSGTQSDPYVVT